jgi:hypothetical protein
VAVVAVGVGTYELLVAGLVGASVACDVVVVAGEAEAIRVTADEGCHGKALVAASGTAVDDDHVNGAHNNKLFRKAPPEGGVGFYIQLVTPIAVAMADRIEMAV